MILRYLYILLYCLFYHRRANDLLQFLVSDHNTIKYKRVYGAVIVYLCFNNKFNFINYFLSHKPYHHRSLCVLYETLLSIIKTSATSKQTACTHRRYKIYFYFQSLLKSWQLLDYTFSLKTYHKASGENIYVSQTRELRVKICDRRIIYSLLNLLQFLITFT